MDNIKNKSTLIVCNTLFQIFVATHIRMKLFKDDAAFDIVVSDHSNNSEQIAENIRKTGIYRNVFFIKNKKTKKHGTGLFHAISYAFRRTIEILRNEIIARKISRKGKYDILFISNISIFTVLLYNRLLKKNKKMNLNLFEEGMSNYCRFFTHGDKPDSLHRKWINKKGIIENLHKLYLFNEQYLEWDAPNGEIVHLEKIDVYDKHFSDVINTIFGVSEMTDKYDRKIIFFEESFFADGFEVADVELVNQIADKFGRENIMIKIHPRNRINRFAALGYKTNVNTNIPWEVIILNQDLSDKILVTISSGSVLNPYLYFENTLQSYSLLNCLEKKPGCMEGELGDLMQKAYKSHPDLFLIPQTIGDFFVHLNTKINSV